VTSLEKALRDFAQFAANLRGDEKSEAQTFLFHLLAAFGHDSNTLPEGSTFEYRVRSSAPAASGDAAYKVPVGRVPPRGAQVHTKYADFVWPGRALIEMKSRGVKLSKHYQQTFDYWLNLVPHRPPYVVLCNFDEFWIYDFNTQLNEPVDRLRLAELPERHAALNFLFPRAFQPLFAHNWVHVTREAARDVAHAFNSLVFRGEDRVRARRFILQCVVAMFAEDIGLLPQDLFTHLLDECRRGASSYDLIGGLFRQMNDKNPARAGRYAGVDYFNGGLFATVDPIELTPPELGELFAAANENNWGYVQPVIFGTLFEGSLGKEERHALGAHFTYESDIQKIVRPTIVRPWDERIAAARSAPDLLALLKELREFRVLDPACGSGNFLFVAYRSLRELEQRLLLRLFAQDKRQFAKVGLASGISPKCFFGIDVNDNAVETAKVTLMLARRLAHREAEKFWADHTDELPGQDTHSLEFERDLPLDNLDANILCADALFTPWPEADAIIGNPPFLGSRYLAKEHGYDYARKVYAAFPAVPKMADFCVLWFRLAHDRLKPGGRAGLVGTKTIRQNESREASLDYVTANGGTITEAVSHQVWSGEAQVHVSLVNWLKGEQPGTKKLFTQVGDAKDSPWQCAELDTIGPTLSVALDVTAARHLRANEEPKLVYQGQNPVQRGFFLEPQEALDMLKQDPRLRDVLYPYMIGDDLVALGKPSRWVIDFAQREMTEAMRYRTAFERVKELVMPEVLAKAEAEKKATGKDSTRWTRMANRWWQFRDYQPGTMAAIARLPRYIACPRVTKRPVFEFIASSIHPDTMLAVFAFADDYSFGILQSGIHWAWFTAKCSTLTARFRYTSDTVFDTFPWPQSPTLAQVKVVAEAAVALRGLRREILQTNGWSLRDLYRSLETPGANRLRDAHAALDSAVRAAYGMKDGEDSLAFLLRLNLELAAVESKGGSVSAPGLPAAISHPQFLISPDCIQSQ
jgi:SAM-dependent methyltransferase